MTDARDVIARFQHQLSCHARPECAEVDEYDLEDADALLRALDAAGLSITATPDTWEWGRESEFDWTDVTDWGDGPEAQGNAEADVELNGGKVVRRRPAGPWEVAPDA